MLSYYNDQFRLGSAPQHQNYPRTRRNIKQPRRRHLGDVTHPGSYRTTTPDANRRTTTEYGRLSIHFRPTRQTAKKMGRPFDRYSPVMASNPPHFPVPPSNSRTVFTFSPPLSLPTTPLSFPPQSVTQPRNTPSRKRRRALTDVDEENSCLWKKKRRLRLFLITSRLSSPFSAPATNIVDRGSSKIAVWAKQKALGRNLLRKAAILNRIRRQDILAKEEGSERVRDPEREQKQFELARLAFLYGSHDTHTRPVLQRSPNLPPATAVRDGDHFDLSGSPNAIVPTTSSTPSQQASQDGEDGSALCSPNAAYSYLPPRAQLPRRDYTPLGPSPLGLSNYDAFDLEDDIPNRYADLDDDFDETESDDGMHDHDREYGSPSAYTSASFATTLSTAGSGSTITEALQTPPQVIYSDFNVLEPGDAVMEGYEGVDGVDGIDAVWPGIPTSVMGEIKRTTPTPRPPHDGVNPVQRDLRHNPPDSEERKEEGIRVERERQKKVMFLNFA